MNLSPDVQRIVAEEQINPVELETMVRDSTPYTHEWANRRWLHWMFKYNRSTETIERMAHIPSIRHTKQGGLWEECEECDGVGCRSCGWVGEVWRSF